MVGKRMFITGGVGAIAEDEKFGPDYYLPDRSVFRKPVRQRGQVFSRSV
jgi:DUF1680 family protein